MTFLQKTILPKDSTNNVSPTESTTATSVDVGKEIGEVSKETEVDYKNDSEDVKGIKIDDNRVDKNGNKVAVDKIKPPAPKLDEEAAHKSNKQKKKCLSKWTWTG